MVKHAQRFKGNVRSVNSNTELKRRKIKVNIMCGENCANEGMLYVKFLLEKYICRHKHHDHDQVVCIATGP